MKRQERHQPESWTIRGMVMMRREAARRGSGGSGNAAGPRSDEQRMSRMGRVRRSSQRGPESELRFSRILGAGDAKIFLYSRHKKLES